MEWTTFWTYVVVIITILMFAHERYKEIYEKQKAVTERKSLQLYVRTGKKNLGFHLADSSSIASAERARLKVIEEQRRAIENENIQFTAVQVCPKCKLLDVHYLRIREDGQLNGRKCRSYNCGYEWHTVG